MPNSRKSLPGQLTRRQAIKLGSGAALGAAVGGGLAVPAHAARSDSLDNIFDAAADVHGVPRDLLAAIGFAETRLRHNDGPSQANGFGIMHLASNPSHRTLNEAARLTRTAPATLKSDSAANIDGAAAVLRAYADDAGLAAGDRADVDAWYPVVARYSGASTPYVARLYADGVYDWLASGFDKEGVAVSALGVDPNRAAHADEVGIQSSHVDYPPAHWVAAHSSNYTVANRPSSNPINYVVCHIMQGTYAGTISWFQNPASNVTTHYCVRSSDGDITQMVRHKDIGWHAGNWSYNQQSIGIEHEGWFNEPHWYTEVMYRSSAALTRFVCDQYGIPKNRSRVLRHGEVSSTPCPGPIWDFDRYMSYVNEGNGGEPIWDVVVDATSADFSAPSSWQQSSWNSQKYGDFYRFNTPQAISEVAWYAADLPENGSYRVDVWYPSDSGYHSAAPHHIVTSSGNQVVNVDQRSGGGQWRSIGTFTMNAGRRNVVGVSRWAGGSGYIIADAVRISLLG
jgi:hypothetical protein